MCCSFGFGFGLSLRIRITNPEWDYDWVIVKKSSGERKEEFGIVYYGIYWERKRERERERGGWALKLSKRRLMAPLVGTKGGVHVTHETDRDRYMSNANWELLGASI